jgi:hypothetical protein
MGQSSLLPRLLFGKFRAGHVAYNGILQVLPSAQCVSNTHISLGYVAKSDTAQTRHRLTPVLLKLQVF